MPATMFRINLVKGLGPALQIAEGQFVDLPAEMLSRPGRTHQPDLADALVRAERSRARARSATFIR